MSSNYWAGFVRNFTTLFGFTVIGLWAASMEGGGWASMESLTSGS